MGKPLGPKGLSWLKLHANNLTGSMKRDSIARRREEAEARLSDMLDSAQDPWEEGSGGLSLMTSCRPWPCVRR